MSDEPTHYISIEVNGRTTAKAYVLEASKFIRRGGLDEAWGKNWIPVHAKSIVEARKLALEYRESMLKLEDPLPEGAVEPLQRGPDLKGGKGLGIVSIWNKDWFAKMEEE